MSIKVIIFDFDGTLVDTKLDIARSVNILLREEGYKTIPEERIIEFIGNGTDVLLEKSFLYAGGKMRDEVIERYIDIYEEHMLDNTKPFPGILDVLESVKDKSLYVLTNKHERFARKILSHFNMLNYFKEVIGADTFNIKKPEPTLVNRILKKEKVKNKEAILIGDSTVDIETGKNARIPVCVVLWGLGEREELLKRNPDFVVEKPDEILKVINGLN